jgi:hypothetical protein
VLAAVGLTGADLPLSGLSDFPMAARLSPPELRTAGGRALDLSQGVTKPPRLCPDAAVTIPRTINWRCEQ